MKLQISRNAMFLRIYCSHVYRKKKSESIHQNATVVITYGCDNGGVLFLLSYNF